MVLVEASQAPPVQPSSPQTRSRVMVDPRLFGAPDDTPDVRRYRQMLTIRRFEERLLALFEAGKLNGTTHACIGQEADAVGVIEHLGEGDHIFSNHRCHGHYLAWSGDVDGLLAEITGVPGGVCAGIGGSQHLCGPGFASNGILGGTLPAAAGIALAYKLDRARVGGQPGRLSVVFCGDGALGEGIVYETLNMASLWALPLLVVVENNRYAQSTPISTNLAGSIAGRFAAFGIPVRELASFDVNEISAAAAEEVAAARLGGGPRALIIDTYRLCHHSKNDDDRPRDEVARQWAFEPIATQAPRVGAAAAAISADVEHALDDAFARVLGAGPR